MSFIRKKPIRSKPHTYETSEGEKRKITSICFPLSLYDELKGEATKIGISVSNLVVTLVQDYLEYQKNENNEVQVVGD